MFSWVEHDKIFYKLGTRLGIHSWSTAKTRFESLFCLVLSLDAVQLNNERECH